MDELRRIAERLGDIEDPRALLEGLFARSPVPMLIYRVDGEILVASHAFRELFGSSPPAGYNVLQDAQLEASGMLALLRRGFAGEVVHLPAHWYQPRDGDEHGRRAGVELTALPIHDGDAQVRYVALCFKDVTAQLELAAIAEELSAQADQRRRLETNLAAAQRIAHLGSWELDLVALEHPASNPLGWSDEAYRIFGLQPGTVPMTSERLVAAVHPDDRKAVVEAVARAIDCGTPYAFDHRIRRPDGTERIVHQRSEIIRNDAGRPVRIYATIQDVTVERHHADVQARSTELELQNQRINEANRLKSEFLANMSHELRTPLNAIIGFSELLYDRRIDPATPQHHQFLGDILVSARHLLQLINDVLDLAKVEAGKLEFRPEPVELGDLIGEVIAILRTTAATRRLRLTTELDPELTEITLDPGRFKQVLYNYVSNALKFTPEDGRVVIRTLAEEPDRFRLEVEDSGVGIAPADIGRLFIEFQQLDTGIGKRHSGTGLGLALTRRLVEAQGGSVGVRSAVGQGSVFHAVLPRRARAGEVRVLRRTISPPHNVPAVLVVEDDAADQQSMITTLARAGYAIEVAGNGAEALARCRSRTFDAITLDLLLPDMTGLELLAGIRASGRNRDTPVLVVTVVASAAAVAGSSVDAVLTKPIEAEELLLALRGAIVRPAAAGPA